jgi:hypothetical protein
MLPVNLFVASANEALRPASTLVITVAWLRNTFATPVVVTVLILAAALFPTGRPLSSRWTIGLWMTLVGGSLLAAAAAADPSGMVSYPSIPNPTALASDLSPIAEGTRLVGVAVLVASAGLAIAVLVRRYRGGESLERAQLRWVLLAAVITAAAGIPFLLSRYVSVVSETTGEFLAAASELGSVSFPVAIAIAISRYRLFDIDVLLGRTLVYRR